MKYQIIVADPPWQIKKIIKRVRPNQIDMDYPTMSTEEICDLPVSQIIDNNCILFLWTIDRYLHNGAIKVLESWGFKYHLTMTWDKTNGLAMFGFNRQTEFILVGFKGKIEAYPKRKTIRTSFTAKSEYHSAKPDLFYEMLDILPYNPRLDMFARKERKNLLLQNHWDVVGNEINGKDIKQELEEIINDD